MISWNISSFLAIQESRTCENWKKGKYARMFENYLLILDQSMHSIWIFIFLNVYCISICAHSMRHKGGDFSFLQSLPFILKHFKVYGVKLNCNWTDVSYCLHNKRLHVTFQLEIDCYKTEYFRSFPFGEWMNRNKCLNSNESFMSLQMSTIVIVATLSGLFIVLRLLNHKLCVIHNFQSLNCQ